MSAPSPSPSAGPRLRRWRERLFVLLQYPLPQHGLSRLMHRIAGSESRPLKDLLIRTFVRIFDIDMGEAVEPQPTRYRSFNAFFTRALRADARPLAAERDALLCPADGAVSQCGNIAEGRLYQAKGRDFGLRDLLGGDDRLAAPFDGGAFATIYLSPTDYHRVHMPIAGVLRTMLFVPGRLFSVNPVTARLVPRLFARNERLICVFDTEVGPVALILVGAIFVGSMATVWSGNLTAPPDRSIRRWTYGEGDAPPIRLERGAEMGRFNMGSTVILLLPANRVTWAARLTPGMTVRMGQSLGKLTRAPTAAP